MKAKRKVYRGNYFWFAGIANSYHERYACFDDGLKCLPKTAGEKVKTDAGKASPAIRRAAFSMILAEVFSK